MEDTSIPGSQIERLLNLFGHLNRATHFLPILTDLYSRRLINGNEGGAGGDDERWQDGWVYDEWTVAVNASIAGEIEFVGIWRSGDKLPEPFTAANVCDFRGNDLAVDLDRYFPALRVLVTGVHADGTAGRVFGPVLYNTWPEVASRLQQEDGYTDFAIMLQKG
jgi:hypothetical protein